MKDTSPVRRHDCNKTQKSNSTPGHKREDSGGNDVPIYICELKWDEKPCRVRKEGGKDYGPEYFGKVTFGDV